MIGCRRACAVLLGLALAGWTLPGGAQTSEAELKGAFIFNFAKYVEWPAEAFGASSGDLVLCLVGSQNELFDVLGEKQGKSVQNRTLRVRSARRDENLKTCHLLVIDESESEHFEGILRRSAGNPILSINGSGRFLDAGGIIGLINVNDKLRFDVNLAAARKNNLAVSSNLLKLARTVRQ